MKMFFFTYAKANKKSWSMRMFSQLRANKIRKIFQLSPAFKIISILRVTRVLSTYNFLRNP